MGAKGDPFSIRGVGRDASPPEVRAAHLRQVKALDGRVDDPITAEPLEWVSRGPPCRARAVCVIGFLISSASVLLVLGFLLPQDEKSTVGAKPESVVTGLTTTISQIPGGTEEEREIAWTEAERTGSREAWQRFIEVFPHGDHAAKAQQVLADIDAAEAPQRADRAALAEAKKSEAKPTLRWYLSNWVEAKRALALLEEDKIAEDVAWSKAVLGNSRGSYAAYLGAYPTGRRAADARARIAELSKPKLSRMQSPLARQHGKARRPAAAQ